MWAALATRSEHTNLRERIMGLSVIESFVKNPLFAAHRNTKCNECASMCSYQTMACNRPVKFLELQSNARRHFAMA